MMTGAKPPRRNSSSSSFSCWVVSIFLRSVRVHAEAAEDTQRTQRYSAKICGRKPLFRQPETLIKPRPPWDPRKHEQGTKSIKYGQGLELGIRGQLVLVFRISHCD